MLSEDSLPRAYEKKLPHGALGNNGDPATADKTDKTVR
jgi:hypothetical protein